MEKITTVGIDLAKAAFSLHGVDGAGRVLLRRSVRRDQLVEVVAGLSPCLIGMEACSGAHDWGRLAIHRVRQGFIVERTAIINRLRGLMAEFGVVLPLRSITVRRQAAEAAEALPALARRAINDLLDQLRVLDERIGDYDREIEAQARQSDAAKRLMQIRGIGPTTALAIVATVGNAREFKNGRQFAAWIGLVPGQYSTGGRTRLGQISKRGDAYLRNLLVQGARSVLNTACAHQDRMSRWALELQPRRGYYRTLVAIANKNARIAWALLARNEDLRTV